MSPSDATLRALLDTPSSDEVMDRVMGLPPEPAASLARAVRVRLTELPVPLLPHHGGALARLRTRLELVEGSLAARDGDPGERDAPIGDVTRALAMPTGAPGQLDRLVAAPTRDAFVALVRFGDAESRPARVRFAVAALLRRGLSPERVFALAAPDVALDLPFALGHADVAARPNPEAALLLLE